MSQIPSFPLPVPGHDPRGIFPIFLQQVSHQVLLPVHETNILPVGRQRT
jgi:hypothetical protein